ncbi:hypothetical protein CKO25_19780, partial [Thiocapsa imhoffii]
AVFGKRVLICADRFHIARLYRESFETLRKREWKRLQRTLTKSTLDQFKNVHWLLRHRRADLTDDERRILNRLFVHSPQIKDAHDACEALTMIYERPLSTGQGKRQIRRWMRQVSNRGIRCFDRFLGTLRTHFAEITNYFVNRQTSGFVKRLNNQFKVLKRRCYGITYLAHLYQRVYLDLNGYARFGVEST